MNGVQLYEGWNEITYEGPTQKVEAAIKPIDPYVVRIWVYRDGVWLMYDPEDPIGTDLEKLYHGEEININVSEPVFWSWNDVPENGIPLLHLAGIAAGGAVLLLVLKEISERRR